MHRPGRTELIELAAEVTHLLDEAAADTHGHDLDGTLTPGAGNGADWLYTIYPGKTISVGTTPGTVYQTLTTIRDTLNVVLGNY